MEDEIKEGSHQTAFLFADYASLTSGLCKKLYEDERIVQEYFEEAAHITGLNITRLLFNSSESELRSLPDAYAVLFLAQVSCFEYARSQDIVPVAVGGYGIGAYAALYAAGAFTFADGLYIVSKWASTYEQILHEKNLKKIAVTGLSYKELKKLSAEYNDHEIAISEKISDEQYAVSGVRSVVEEYEEKLRAKNTRAIITERALEGGLYAPCSTDTSATFKQYLEKVEFKDAQITCFSPHASEDLVTAPQIKEFILQQPFLFQDHVQLIERYAAYDTLIVPGADEGLLNQLHARYPEKNSITYR